MLLFFYPYPKYPLFAVNSNRFESKNMLKNIIFHPFYLQIRQKAVPLHCVFHSIRFKVNKGWSKALLLFLCPYVPVCLRASKKMTNIAPYYNKSDNLNIIFHYAKIIFHADVRTDRLIGICSKKAIGSLRVRLMEEYQRHLCSSKRRHPHL